MRFLGKMDTTTKPHPTHRRFRQRRISESQAPTTRHTHNGAASIPPKCRPIEQKQPNFVEFWWMGLRFGESRRLEPLRTHP